MWTVQRQNSVYMQQWSWFIFLLSALIFLLFCNCRYIFSILISFRIHYCESLFFYFLNWYCFTKHYFSRKKETFFSLIFYFTIFPEWLFKCLANVSVAWLQFIGWMGTYSLKIIFVLEFGCENFLTFCYNLIWRPAI